MSSMIASRSSPLATAAATIVLFAVGGLVRGTGSGLGCSTWPTCYARSALPGRHGPFADRVLPPVPGVRRPRCWSSRTAVVAWRRPPSPVAAVARAGRGPARLRPGGARRHRRAHGAEPVVGHRALRRGARVRRRRHLRRRRRVLRREPPERATTDRRATAAFARLTLSTTVATGALLLVGTYVRAQSARARVHGLAADGRPARPGARRRGDGDVRPPGARGRLVFLLVLWVAIRAAHDGGRARRTLVRLSTLALASSSARSSPARRTSGPACGRGRSCSHVALSVLIWATLVALATVAEAARPCTPSPPGSRPSRRRPRAGRRRLRSATPIRPTSASRSRGSSCCCSSRPCPRCSLPRRAIRRRG